MYVCVYVCIPNWPLPIGAFHVHFRPRELKRTFAPKFAGENIFWTIQIRLCLILLYLPMVAQTLQFPARPKACSQAKTLSFVAFDIFL